MTDDACSKLGLAAQSPEQGLHSSHHTAATLLQKKSLSQFGELCPEMMGVRTGLTFSHSQWRERRDFALAEREKISASKKEETIKAARQNLDDFYENYGQKTEKQIAKTRKEAEEFLANREDTSAGGTSWERIAKLVDLSGKGAKGGASGTGKEKFREMLLDLRKDEKAPGATGY